MFAIQAIDDEKDFMSIEIMDMEDESRQSSDIPEELPILVLKNTVLFPGIVIPITVGRDKSIKAIQDAHSANKLVAVISQKNPSVEDPGEEDMYNIGTVARILKLLKMPDGTTTAILKGRTRFALRGINQSIPYLKGNITTLNYDPLDDQIKFRAIINSVKDIANQIIELSPQIPSDAALMLKNIDNDPFLLNFIASNLGSKVKVKQTILAQNNLMQKAEQVLEQMDSELQLLELKDQIQSKVRGDIEKQQRDYFLNQQLKTIQEELGQSPQQEDLKELKARADKKKWPIEIKEAFDKEFGKLQRANPQVAEFNVLLTYLEFMVDLPWEKYTKDNFDLQKVQKILDRDHFGLKKVKERILEHLAVLKLKGDMKAPIICLVGPPGVGKTSLGRSIARALKRKFVRMSLGGLHDESEIRGHRKTYIGAMPGRILQGLKKSKSSNPVFILDEIDKVGKDFRGDPSSALLEVLDPEQNTTFHDNYLDLEYDLSKVLFIATANNLSTIQPALLDRMEIIDVSGYSTEEKMEIAKKHLIPKQREAHGLTGKQVKFDQKSIESIIQNYTRESGVRSLDRTLGKVMRHTAKKIAMNQADKLNVKSGLLKEILGPARYTKDQYSVEQTSGVAVGLAWTRVGGDILFIEASLSDGKGKLTLTGNLGDVMKESATTALSYVKANAGKMGIDKEVFSSKDIHIHVPEGAIPKDGPSAGITMLSALVSALNKSPVKPYLAMTGEITLRGKVLPVGGIKEKILAAKRAGINEIILCDQNKKDVEQIDPHYIDGLKFHYVHTMGEVLEIAIGF
ncbi:MAG: endopeptidase La [Bacteroidia bacterium]|nr:endopeptidase La [Bacteroidia bacterium]